MEPFYQVRSERVAVDVAQDEGVDLLDKTRCAKPRDGNACSGDLQQPFSYTGPADLQGTATSLTTALDPAYYSGIQHHTAVTSSSALRVSGHQAWEIKFTVSYDDDAGQGVTWSNEFGAVVVVNRGLGEQPAVFYVSVPDNLGTSAVSTLLGSLQLS